ncbi:MAG: Na/Pi cotransporter family protein, partial [Opitutaceae bacterium]|nr:Na/Pi cotransporter family protein [Opitutaceae bacterium]
GFVSAGMLTTIQATGVIIGSSVGTTSMGWIISLLGLQYSLSAISLPLIGVGALMRLILKNRASVFGLAIAGFGLMFFGLETLQQGMEGISAHVRPEAFPQADWSGRILLMLVGIALTVVMQSSSAVVATAITAYHTGSLDLAQSLTIVIGASIGTTVTTLLVSIGANVPVRRTALVHILFNSFASLLGYVLQPAFIALLVWLTPQPGAWAIAAFHTAFTLAAALLVLPAVGQVSTFITRLIRDPAPDAARHFDDTLVQVPEVALEALRRALCSIGADAAAWIRHHADGRGSTPPTSLTAVRRELDECHDFLTRIPATVPVHQHDANPRLSVVHVMDHLDQIISESTDIAAIPTADISGRLTTASAHLHTLLAAFDRVVSATPDATALPEIKKQSAALAALRRTGRHALLRETAEAQLTPAEADRLLDAVRWMDTSAYHLWRIGHHLQQAAGETPHA